jgi:hypothetical protein
MAQLNFDATQVDPNKPLELLPPGKYPVQIIQSEKRPTKDGLGSYIWLEMEILEGEQKGRKLWDRLNLENKNAQAVDIAQRTLSAICHAVGIVQIRDSEQLHFRAMTATVKIKPAQGQYDANNEVKGYEPYGAAAPQRPLGAPQAAGTATAAGGSTQSQTSAPAAAPTPAPAKATPPWRQARA